MITTGLMKTGNAQRPNETLLHIAYRNRDGKTHSGKFSEMDTESYAIKMLRAWRNRNNII